MSTKAERQAFLARELAEQRASEATVVRQAVAATIPHAPSGKFIARDQALPQAEAELKPESIKKRERRQRIKAGERGPNFSTEDYQRLVAAFRDTPGNVLRASLAAGCSTTTAKKFWEQGSATDKRMPAIKALFENEALAARALAAQEIEKRTRAEQETAALARAAQLKAQSEELQGTSLLRSVALGMVGTAARSTVIADQALALLAEQVGIVFDPQTGQASRTPGFALKKTTSLHNVVASCSKISHTAASVLSLALEAERIATGQPLYTVSHKLGLEALTPEQLATNFGHIARIAEKAERRRKTFNVPAEPAELGDGSALGADDDLPHADE